MKGVLFQLIFIIQITVPMWSIAATASNLTIFRLWDYQQEILIEKDGAKIRKAILIYKAKRTGSICSPIKFIGRFTSIREREKSFYDTLEIPASGVKFLHEILDTLTPSFFALTKQANIRLLDGFSGLSLSYITPNDSVLFSSSDTFIEGKLKQTILISKIFDSIIDNPELVYSYKEFYKKLPTGWYDADGGFSTWKTNWRHDLYLEKTWPYWCLESKLRKWNEKRQKRLLSL